MSTNAVPTISFHRQGGGTWTLGDAGSSNPVRLIRGARGLGVSPMTYASTPKLAGHGSKLRGRRANEREIFIPILIDTGSMSQNNVQRSNLTALISPMDKRDLTLRVKVPGQGAWREIPVVYSSGLEGDYGDEYHGSSERRGIVFKAHDALWRGEPRTITQQVDSMVKPFLSDTEEFFPVLLSDSSVEAQLTVTVAGDAPTYPIWTITPPGSELTIRHKGHDGPGGYFHLDGILNEVVTIDMARGRITTPTYQNQEMWTRVTDDSRMFELTPGKNLLEFSMIGSTPDSMVHVTYAPQHLAAI